MRYLIYEYALIGENKFLVYGKFGIKSHDMALGLLLSSRSVYNEAYPFFWKNVFDINGLGKKIKGSTKIRREHFMNNVLRVHFRWGQYRMRDALDLQWLRKCKNIDTLHVTIIRWYKDNDPWLYRDKPQRLFQDNRSIKPFSSWSAFDQLVSVGGLKSVKLSDHMDKFRNVPRPKFEALEKFLLEKLIEPIHDVFESQPLKLKVSLWFKYDMFVYSLTYVHRRRLLVSVPHLFQVAPEDHQDS